MTIPGINGGTKVTTGFGREAVLAAAGTVAQAVRQNKLRHIFLVGGCDGARPGRNYYTDFVKQAPEDTLCLLYTSCDGSGDGRTGHIIPYGNRVRQAAG